MAPRGLTDEAVRELIHTLETTAHAQRAMREILQGMALPIFDDYPNPEPNNTSVSVVPKGSAPLQVVRSVIVSTGGANATLQLGLRKIPIPVAGTSVIAPVWLLLHPADVRKLTIGVATSLYFELMGFEVPNTALAELVFRLQA